MRMLLPCCLLEPTTVRRTLLLLCRYYVHIKRAVQVVAGTWYLSSSRLPSRVGILMCLLILLLIVYYSRYSNNNNVRVFCFSLFHCCPSGRRDQCRPSFRCQLICIIYTPSIRTILYISYYYYIDQSFTARTAIYYYYYLIIFNRMCTNHHPIHPIFP